MDNYTQEHTYLPNDLLFYLKQLNACWQIIWLTGITPGDRKSTATSADANKEVNRISGKTGVAKITPVFPYLSVVPVWQVESGFSPHR